MNRSWLIALASTAVLSAVVAFELRGLWRPDEGASAGRRSDSPRVSRSPAVTGPDAASPPRTPAARVVPFFPASGHWGGPVARQAQRSPASHVRSPFRPVSSVTRLPRVAKRGGQETPHEDLPIPERMPDPMAPPAVRRSTEPRGVSEAAEEILPPVPDATASPADAARRAAGPTGPPAVPVAPPAWPAIPLVDASNEERRLLFEPPVLPRRLPATHPIAARSNQAEESAESADPAIERLPGIGPPPLGNEPTLADGPSLGPAAPAGEDIPSAEDLPFAPPLAPSQSESSPSDIQHVGAWWAALVPQPQRGGSEPLPLDIATLIQETIFHSEHVQAVSIDAQVAETEIIQADAAFDPAAFIDSKWIDLSDPVGNVLTTGGPPRLSREEWSSSVGFRRKTPSGGALEIAQRLVGEDNNSIFFVPADQATTRLTVSLNQPLLKGGGRAFNRSLILLAMHDTQIARDRFRAELETQVLRVVREYWELYYQRAVLLQQQSALRQAEEILEDIRARAAFDSLASQVQRVRATVAIREAHIVRARAAVRNAESRLRALTNSPLLGGMDVELLPIEPPLAERITLPAEDARELALANRTEVDAALARIRAAGVELGMSKNEMLPTLGLVLESYVSGLEGAFDLAESLGDQFSQGAPSYTAGLVFEMPLGGRRARAFHKQKVLELRQAEHVFRDTVATLSSEVEIALREVETTWQELVARRESAEATRAEVAYLRARLELIPGDDSRGASFLMEELLNAIDRLVRDESELAAAQRNYAVSIAEFHRATGMLVAVESPTK